MKTKTIFIITFLLLKFSIHSQQYNWTKTTKVGGVSNLYDVLTDYDYNTYLVGNYSGTADLDPGPEEFIVTSNGSYDVFIIKLNSNGDFLWGKSFGGSEFDTAHSAGLDVNQGLYVAGSFSGTVDFNTNPNEELIIESPNTGKGSNYIVSYDNNTFNWAKAYGAINSGASPVTLTVDGLDIYSTGGFRGTADFDPSEADFLLTSNGNEDVFVLKLNRLGELIWAKSFEGSSANDYGYTIAIDENNGDVIIGGDYITSIDLDPDPLSKAIHTAPNNDKDYFLVKLDKDGNYKWSKSAESIGQKTIYNVVLDSEGSIYATGFFQESGDLAPGDDEFFVDLQADYTGFVIKFSSEGKYQWAYALDGLGVRAGIGAIAIDEHDDIYIGGDFQETIDFDPSSETFELTANNANTSTNNLFIQKITQDGDFVWAHKLGNPDISAELKGLMVNPLDELLIGANVFGFNNADFDYDFSEGEDNFNPFNFNISLSNWSIDSITLSNQLFINDNSKEFYYSNNKINTNLDGIYDINIYNLTGQLIKQSKKEEINPLNPYLMNSLETGLYFIELSSSIMKPKMFRILIN